MRQVFKLIVIFIIASAGAILYVDFFGKEEIKAPSKMTSRKAVFVIKEKQEATKKEEITPASKNLSVRPPAGGVRVVLISVDGFRTDLVQYMPGFREMQKHGAWTLRATTTIPSITTTAHASMFTGQPPEVHGVIQGAPHSGAALKSWHPLKTETIFTGLDASHYKPMAFVQKEKLLRLLPEKILVRKVLDRATRESVIVKEVCAEVAKPDGSRMLIVHLKRFDAEGHDNGWMSDSQVRAAKPMDKALLSISGCLSDAQNSGDGTFALIVTADHGGSGYDHDTRKETDMHIPWLIIGPGVKKDHEIRRAMHVMDTAAVVRYFLGFGDEVHSGIRGRFPREILMH